MMTEEELMREYTYRKLNFMNDKFPLLEKKAALADEMAKLFSR